MSRDDILWKAASNVERDVRGMMAAFETEMREAIGHTNFRVLKDHNERLRAVLDAGAVPAQVVTPALSWQDIPQVWRVVEAAAVLVSGMPYTMGKPGDGEHNRLREAVRELNEWMRAGERDPEARGEE